MKFVFKIGSFDLKAQGNTMNLNDVVVETELSSEEFVQNSKDAVLIIKDLMATVAAEQTAAQARRDERSAERSSELELARLRNEA